MNKSQRAGDSFRKTTARFEELARDTQVPEAMRDLAERNIAQMRETYERSKGCAGRRVTKLGEIL